MNRLDGKIDPARIGGPGAAVSYVLTWDGGRAVWSAGGGDTTHPGTGLNSMQIGLGTTATATKSTAVGEGATAVASYATSLGYSADADGADSTAVGGASDANATRSTALGGSSTVGSTATDGIAIGYDAFANAARAIAIGKGAASSVADRAVIQANDLEVKRSNGTGATGLRLYNEASSPYVLGLHVGTSAPTNGCVFWYDTDDTC